MIVTKESRKKLKEYYKFIYRCRKCAKMYGADKPETYLLCPICDDRFKNAFKKKKKHEHNINKMEYKRSKRNTKLQTLLLSS
jgi:rRNA maturation endonuclease Nob1